MGLQMTLGGESNIQIIVIVTDTFTNRKHGRLPTLPFTLISFAFQPIFQPMLIFTNSQNNNNNIDCDYSNNLPQVINFTETYQHPQQVMFGWQFCNVCKINKTFQFIQSDNSVVTCDNQVVKNKFLHNFANFPVGRKINSYKKIFDKVKCINTTDHITNILNISKQNFLANKLCCQKVKFKNSIRRLG